MQQPPPGSEGDRHGQAQSLSRQAVALAEEGRFEQAADNYRQALAIFRELDDRPAEGQTLTQLGGVLADQGHMEQASESWRAALAIARDVADRRGEGEALPSSPSPSSARATSSGPPTTTGRRWRSSGK